MEVAVPVVQAGESIADLQRQINALSAEQAILVCEWDKQMVWADDGSRSAKGRLSRDLGLSDGDAARLLSRARNLDSMPLTLAAYESGDLSVSQVDLLCRASHLALFSRDEAMLIEQVQSLHFNAAKRVVEYWMQRADPDGAEDKAKKQLEQRSAYVSKTFEGSVDLKALFDPIGGEIFLNEFERQVDLLFKEDWAEAKERVGEDVRVEDLQRTPAQRRADALVVMAMRSAGAQPGASQRPLISVIVGDKSFEGVCEAAGGTVLTPGQIVPLLSRAQIERIVFDGPSRLVDVGHRRFFTGALRRAIEVRDRHCQDASGCFVPAKNCEGDHVTAFVKGGKTVLTNGQLMCGRHNRRKGAGPP